MRVHELRADVVHVVGHAAQDGVGYRFGAVAALGLVAPELLDPLQIDDGYHADQQVRVLGDVDVGRYNSTMQPFVKQQVGVGGHVFPGRESAGLLLVGRGFVVVVQVLAAFAGAGFGVGAEQLGQLGKQVVGRTEMAEVVVASLFRFGSLAFHFLAVMAMKAVAFNDSGVDAFTPENIFKRPRHRRSARTGRTGDRNDGVAFRHGEVSGCKK